MTVPLAPRAVVVHRRSELELLLERHGTRGQAEFFLRSRGQTLAAVQARHDALEQALQQVEAGIPGGWRRATLERADLPRLSFAPEDVVLAVGPDGLVANVAKYVTTQLVIGIDPEPGANPGVLVQHAPGHTAAVLAAVESGTARLEYRTQVEAVLDDGQSLRALNELYIGNPGHQSARYRLLPPGADGERQSSSGVLIGTGTGATGWCASLARDRTRSPPLPAPLEQRLAWFVREAWPSPFTGTTCTEGMLEPDQAIQLIAEADLVIFGDGLETDRLEVGWAQQITVHVADQRLALVTP